MPDPSPRPESKAAAPRQDSGASEPATTPPPDPPLTPEEQMERFAQDLKENDWGHQPC